MNEIKKVYGPFHSMVKKGSIGIIFIETIKPWVGCRQKNALDPPK